MEIKLSIILIGAQKVILWGASLFIKQVFKISLKQEDKFPEVKLLSNIFDEEVYVEQQFIL